MRVTAPSAAIAERTPSRPCSRRTGSNDRGGSGSRISAASVNNSTTSSNRRSSTADAYRCTRSASASRSATSRVMV
ncbi:hypothetical protein BHQ17_25155 [Mycolicibacterium holsaticum]|uniref:Uncharacterized protein n=1 Tax=Mycolicibacterium holsaticum TaxID=152142 RepID=A0A1E3R543_9MYCO|nr:hypothetical protein [Mycolicibacterium holsaticum DSM 44478 = JCM 12374]ODQ84973.1 hypothetical protein BHQ17_25155 [Mycolicibacterium holsaticum]